MLKNILTKTIYEQNSIKFILKLIKILENFLT